jgi:hypothetical protein
VGIRCADHVTPSNRKSRHYFADSGGRSVGLVRFRTKATGFFFLFVSRQYDVGFRDACRIVEGDNVLWDSLLMYVLPESKLRRTIIIGVMRNTYIYCVVCVVTCMLWMKTWVLLLLLVLYVFLSDFM